MVQSALVQLRRELGVDEIAPAHWLDRLTAGVLLFTLRPQVRAGYQSIFAERRAIKEYRHSPRSVLSSPEPSPSATASRKRPVTCGHLVVDGEINAVSDITSSTRESVSTGSSAHRAHPSAAPAVRHCSARPSSTTRCTGRPHRPGRASRRRRFHPVAGCWRRRWRSTTR